MKFRNPLLLLTVSAFLLSGCYTQLQYSQRANRIIDEPRSGSTYTWSGEEEAQKAQPRSESEANAVYGEGYEDGYVDGVDDVYYYRDYETAKWYARHGFGRSYYDFPHHYGFSSWRYYRDYYDPFYDFYPGTHVSLSFHFGSSFGAFYGYPHYWYRWHRPWYYSHWYPYYGGFGYHPFYQNNYIYVGYSNYVGPDKNRNNRSYGPRSIGTNRVQAADNVSRTRSSNVTRQTTTTPRTRSTSTSVGKSTTTVRGSSGTTTRVRSTTRSSSSGSGTVTRSRGSSSSSSGSSSTGRTSRTRGSNDISSPAADIDGNRSQPAPRPTIQDREELRNRAQNYYIRIQNSRTRERSIEQRMRSVFENGIFNRNSSDSGSRNVIRTRNFNSSTNNSSPPRINKNSSSNNSSTSRINSSSSSSSSRGNVSTSRSRSSSRGTTRSSSRGSRRN